MVALKHQRPSRFLILEQGRASWAFQFHVFMDGFAVVLHAHELSVGDLLSLGIESRRPENDVKGLPFTGGLAPGCAAAAP